MNGFMLLVLVVLAGQVSPGGLSMPPSLNPVQPASMVTTPPPQTDYGWQINPDNGLLEYIVQISPDKAEFMYKNAKEQESTIPPVVAARVSKIIVRFGTKPIVSTPIEEVLQLPLVNRGEIADNLPTGRIKTLENGNGYDLQNVAGGTQPPTLSPGGIGTSGVGSSGIGSSLTDSTTSLSDKMANALRDPDNLLAQNRNNPGSGFLQDAMGGVNSGASGNNYNSMPGSMPTSTNGLPTSTATTPPPSLPGYSNSTTTQPLNPNFNSNGLGIGSNANNHGAGVPGMGTAGLGTNAYGTNGSYGTNGAYGTNGYSQPHSTATNGNYNSMPGQALPGQTLPGQTNGTYGAGGTRPGFASAPLGTPALNNMPWSATNTGNGYNNSLGLGSTTNYTGQGYANNGTSTNTHGYNQPPYQNQNQYSGTPYNGTPLGGTQYTSTLPGFLPSDPLSLRVADNRGNVPSTAGGISPSTNVVGGRSGWGTRTDGYSNELTDAQRTGMENAMPVMFVLSLVVNFYLGMLIRKLLGRYRTLLASVRSQTV